MLMDMAGFFVGMALTLTLMWRSATSTRRSGHTPGLHCAAPGRRTRRCHRLVANQLSGEDMLTPTPPLHQISLSQIEPGFRSRLSG
jgi:hypothetical protein